MECKGRQEAAQRCPFDSHESGQLRSCELSSDPVGVEGDIQLSTVDSHYKIIR